MSLCTKAQIRIRMGMGATDVSQDDLFDQIVAGVSAMLAAEACLAGHLELADHVDYISVIEPYTHVLWLPASPVVSVDEVKEAAYGEFDDADALTEDEDFQCHYRLGKLIRIGFWLPGENTVKVTYSGGYTPPDVYGAEGYEADAAEVNLPADIQEAAIKQSCYVFQRRGSLGMASKASRGGSMDDVAGDDLLADVRATMQRYRPQVF